jgi:glycosyltransferase involved in cell wall biosynthesis
MARHSNIALLIPAFNASQSLGLLLQQVKSFFPEKNIIVVNDGSTDETMSLCQGENVVLLNHRQNKGKGAALQTGFDYVVQNPFEAVITMDADLQHSADAIPEFFSVYGLRQFDVVIGSRLHNKGMMPFHRVLSNTITTFMVSVRTGVKIADSQSGYRLIDRKVLEKVRLDSNGFEAETEFIIKAAALGFRFGSIPIATIYAGEKSYMTNFATTKNFIRILFKQW